MVSTVTFLCDPLLNDFGPSRPPLLVARALASRYRVRVVSLRVGAALRRRLREAGVGVLDLGIPAFPASPSVSYFLDWIATPLRSFGPRFPWAETGPVVNFSNTLLAPSDAWYVQGPMGEALQDIWPSLPPARALTLRLGLPAVNWWESSLLKRFQALTKVVVANSHYGSRLYESRGIRVAGVLPSPIDVEVFRPPRETPSADYVLAYLGKETDLEALRLLARNHVPLKVFGGKFSGDLGFGPDLGSRIERLPWLDDGQLARLYGHARFTVFPFTTEPFGYIPLESMACGTPVLSYAKQGPAETIVAGRTGWLARDREELVTWAAHLWQQGSPGPEMREACRKRALPFGFPEIGRRWEALLTDPGSPWSWEAPGITPGPGLLKTPGRPGGAAGRSLP
jgi:glycosyltransferase involved in cell wall biosynthesis